MKSTPVVAPADLFVLNVMTCPVISIDANMSLFEVEALFEKADINHAAIVDENCAPVGIISTTDLLRITHWRAFFQPEIQRNSMDAVKKSLLVADLMHRNPTCISAYATLNDAAQLLHQRRFHALPVLDETGRLVGIITAHDLLRAAFPPVQ